MIGIYGIFSGKRVYIGQSVNVKKRWTEHRRYLVKGVHHCLFLQRHYNKNLDISFEILEECSVESLDQKETEYWDKYKSLGFEMFNSRPSNGSRRDWNHSEETKELMKQRKKENPTRYWLGKKRDQKTIDALYSANKGRKHSPKEIEKRRQSTIKYHYVLYKNGVYYDVKDMGSFCKQENLNPSHISEIFSRKRKSCKGFYPISRLTLKTKDVETYQNPPE